MRQIITPIALASLLTLAATPANAETTISYQGDLQDGGSPVDASVDMTFELFDAASGGASVGGPLTENGVTVTNGLFQVELDFGEQPYFNGLWLAVEVEGDLLAPRQLITGAPFAIDAAPGSGSNWEVSGDDIHYTAGRVGIGTISPNVALDVIGSAQFGVAHQASGAYSFIGGGQSNVASGPLASIGGGSDNTASGAYSFIGGGFLNTASGSASFAAGFRANAMHDGTFVWADDGPSFESTGEDQFLIRAGGGVGIGTDSPTRDLHIKQASTDNGSIGLQIERSGTSTNNWGFYIATSDNLGFRYNDNLVARIDTSGQFATLSDARHKTDIGPIENPLTRLLALEPAQYRMRTGMADSQPSLGLIAQQVRDVIPTAVSESEETLGIRYNQITALNTASIIELHAAAQADRNQISQLRDENKALRTQLAELSLREAEVRSIAERNERLEQRVQALESLLAGKTRMSDNDRGEVAP
ncbi:MAG: tail fiber domain-containing protein [Wenzhouxiangella sp.]|jgi:hypothetical protein|nr:tail fiber domain-containing protein [Wenzhouxiangella sp.]